MQGWRLGFQLTSWSAEISEVALQKAGQRHPAAASQLTEPPRPSLPPPAGGGFQGWPGGHTQRLLTVVKSGSIQEVKATPVDKVHTWPHLLAAEFEAALACLAFTFLSRSG